MQHDAPVRESFCYKAIMILYRYFLASVFFKVFIGSVRAICRVSGEIMRNSEIRHLFISGCSACRSNIRYFILALSLSILSCHIFMGLLVFGKVDYLPILLLCGILPAIYLTKKSVIGRSAAICRDSYTFRLINKKI